MAMTIVETSEDDTSIFKTKTNMDSCVKRTKSMLLANQEETTQPRRPIRALPAP